MEEGKKHIDDLFREELGNYQEAPPPAVWTSLDKRLPVAEPVRPPAGGAVAADAPSRRWLWYLLLLALLATLVYFGARNMFSNRPNRGLINENVDSKPNSTIAGTQPSADSLNANFNKDGNPGTSLPAETTDKTSGSNIQSNDASASGIDHGGVTTSGAPGAVTDSKEESGAVNVGTISNNGRTTGQKKAGSKKRQLSPEPSAVSADRSLKPHRTNSSAHHTETTGNARNQNTNGAVSEDDDQLTQTGMSPYNVPPAGQTPKTTSEMTNQSNEPVSITKTTTKKSHMVVTVEDNSKPTIGTELPGGKEKAKAIASRSESHNNTPVVEPAAGISSAAVPEVKRSVAANVSAEKPIKKTRTASTKKPQTKTTDPVKTEEHSPDLSTDSHASAASPSSLSVKNTHAPKRRTSAANRSADAGTLATAPPVTSTPPAKKARGAKASKTTQAPPSGHVQPSAGEAAKAQAEELTQPAAASRRNTKAKQAQAAAGNAPASKGNRNTPAPAVSKAAANSSVKAPVPVAPASSATVVKQNAEAAAPEEAAGKEAKGAATGTGEAAGGPSAPLRNFRRFNFNADAGIKVGYEKGFGSYNTASFIFAPFLQWNISPKVSLVLQPGFRYNQLNNTTLLNDASYHKITGQTLDSQLIVTLDSVQQIWIERQYYYSNTYDSLKAGFKFQSKSYWEIDLPLMLQYYITSKLAVTGGLSLTFGGFNEIKGSVSEVIHRERMDTVKYAPVPINSPAPTPPDLNDHFSYNTLEYNVINPASFNNPSSSPARFGAIIGLSYSLNDRLMVDVLVRKNLSDMKFVPNDQMRKIYTQPYFRFTIGYKMFRSKK